MDEAVGDAIEHLDKHRQPQGGAGIQRLAVDEFDQEMRLADTEQPVLAFLQGVDLDEVLVIEHLGNAELMARLFEKLQIFWAGNRNDLEGVITAVGTAVDMQQGAVRSLAKRTQDLKSADTEIAHVTAVRCSLSALLTNTI